MSKERSIGSNIFSIVSSSYFAVIINFITSYFTLLFLGPIALGLFQTVVMFKDYALFLNIGEVEALRKNIPIISAQSDEKQLHEYLGDTALIQLVTICAVSFILYVISSRFAANYQTTFRVIIVLYILEYLQYHFQNYAKSRNEFSIISKGTICLAILSLSTILLVVYFNYMGFLIGKIIGDIFILAYFYYTLKPQYRFSWKPKNLKLIFTTGIPLIVFSLLNIFLNNAGKLGVFLCFDEYSMGLYSFALLTGVPLIQVAQASSAVLFTKSSSELGCKVDKEQIVQNTIKTIAGIYEYLPLLDYALILAIPFFVPLVLPNYTGAITVSQMVLLGFSSYALALPFTNLMVLFNDKKYLVTFILPGCLTVLFCYIFQMMGMGVDSVGYSVYLGYITFFILSVVFVCRNGASNLILVKEILVKHVISSVLLVISLSIINKCSFRLYLYSVLLLIFVFFSKRKIQIGIGYLYGKIMESTKAPAKNTR
ncbi:MAG: lipopolysaccharide biosynthesis protein [Clostridiales bacterium]